MQDFCILGKRNFCISAASAVTHPIRMDASVHKVQVGDRLRTAIEALGRTQAEVARSIGVSPTKLGNWIRGDNYPPPLAIVALSKRWNITADWLLRGEIVGMASPLADELWKSASASLAGPQEPADLDAGSGARPRRKAVSFKSP